MGEKGYAIRRDYADMYLLYRALYVYYGVQGQDKTATQQLIQSLIKHNKIVQPDPQRPDVFLSQRRVMMKDCVKAVLDSHLEEVRYPCAMKVLKLLKRFRMLNKLDRFRRYVFATKLKRWFTNYELKLSAESWINAVFAKRRQARMRRELMNSRSRPDKDHANHVVDIENRSTDSTGASPGNVDRSLPPRPPRIGGSVPSRREALMKKMREMMRPGGEFETPDMSHIEPIPDLDYPEDPQIGVLANKILALQGELTSKNDELLSAKVGSSRNQSVPGPVPDRGVVSPQAELRVKSQGDPSQRPAADPASLRHRVPEGRSPEQR